MKKVEKKAVKKPAKKIDLVEPIHEKVIMVTEVKEKPEIVYPTKIEVLTKIPLQPGFIRSRVLKDYNGMEDILRIGDIIDLPERRFKSLSFRGLVEEYKGEKQPNKRR